MAAQLTSVGTLTAVHGVDISSEVCRAGAQIISNPGRM